jgi:hypothetical protein
VVESGALPFGGIVLSDGLVLSGGAASVGAMLAESIELPLPFEELSEQAANPIAAAKMKKYFFIKFHFRLKIIAFRTYTSLNTIPIFQITAMRRIND